MRVLRATRVNPFKEHKVIKELLSKGIKESKEILAFKALKETKAVREM